MQIEKYKTRIESMNPLDDSSFVYDIRYWKGLNPSLKNVVQEFENKQLSRRIVVDSFKRYFDNLVPWENPYALTMIWGFANTGYGAYRTNLYYSETNRIYLVQAFEELKKNKWENSFTELQKIKGLNISYISKILYFSTRCRLKNNYCLIYDIRVARALVKLSIPLEIYNIVDIKPLTKIKNYIDYNTYMHTIASSNCVAPDALELFLFQQEF
jgi:hypothetical protein